jgi:protocatechuate 3,4-dioxygenase beta subunit
MKTFHKLALLLVMTLGFRLHAEPGALVKFSGTAVDARGNPVAGAAVDCYRYPIRMFSGVRDLQSKEHAITDDKGAFAFSVSDGPMTVVVKKAGLGSAWKTWQSVPTGAVQSLTLAASSTLAGVVLDENNRPVSGAEVRVSMALDAKDGDLMIRPNYIFGEAAGDVFSARTSADGRFRIVDFPAGAQANFMVSIPGRAMRMGNAPRNGMLMQAQAGQEDIKLITEPAASIEGVVVLRDTGAPLAHAKIEVQPVDPMGGFGSAPHSVQSGADGAFRISEVPAGSYHITAVFTNEPVPLLVAESVPVTIAAGDTARDVKIQAFKGGVVEVTVVGKSDQKAFANVGVSAYSEGLQVSGTTDARGIAWLRLAPGSFSLYAMKEGMSQAQVQTTVIDGQTNRVKLELNSPSVVGGTVRDGSGAPVANTVVGVFPNFGGDTPDVQTDASGHFEVKWQQPAWSGMRDQRYYLVARNIERKLAAVQEVQVTTTSMDLELKDAISISGQVQDARGKAITNAMVYLMVQMNNTGFSINRRVTRADGQGRIRFEGLPSGQHYSVNVSANGYGTSQQTVATADPKANHYEFPPVVLKLADRKLAGRVLGTNGQPVAGVQVWMRGDGQPNNNSMTDADGRFAFKSVCPGPVSLSANSKGLSGYSDATGGDTNVVIRFNANNRVYSQLGTLTISGTVYDSSGNPAAGVHVGVTPSWGQVDSATTDKNGEYSVHWQDQPGVRGAKYFVVAQDTERNLAALEEIDAKKTHASLHLEPGFSITGTVQDAEGKPLTSANVNLNMMAGNMGGMVSREPVRVDSDGTFTIPALPKGQMYHVYVSASGCGSAQRPISKNQSQTNSLQLATIRLRTADRELAGQVLGVDGKPLSGVQVYTYGNNQPNVNARTDADGHFQFKVCAGPINVNAYVQGGRNSFGTTEARGGDMNVVVKIGAPQRRQPIIRALSLKPQPWTLGALIAWPAGHKTPTVVLLALQTVVLLGTGAAVFWMTRKRQSPLV